MEDIMEVLPNNQTVKSVMFNHSILDSTNDDPKFLQGLGVETYLGRALCLTQKGDIIQLPPCIKSEWPHITAHYQRIGLPHTESVIWNESYESLKSGGDYQISVFFYGRKAFKRSDDKKWFRIAKRMNSKNKFLKICRKLNVPTPRTWSFKSKCNIQKYDHFPFPVYLKAAVSVSGFGVRKCVTKESLCKELKQVRSDAPIQIQEEINGVDAFLNMQYFVNGKGKAERVVTTEQILNGNSHSGNVFPARLEPWEITDPIAKYMGSNGMKGYFAFDVAITPKGPFVIECNPRFNGSTYPTVIAQKLCVPVWRAQIIETEYRSLADVRDFHKIEFNPRTKKGVIIINWGSVKSGKLGIMLCGNNLDIKILRRQIKKVF